MEQYVLGVDVGSGSVKLTLLSRQGVIAATAGCEYPTYYPQVAGANKTRRTGAERSSPLLQRS